MPQIEKAEGIAKLLQHSCMSYNFAHCVGYINRWIGADALINDAFMLLNYCEKVLGQEKSRTFLNTCFPLNTGAYGESRSNIALDIDEVYGLVQRYEETGSFYKSFKEYSDLDLRYKLGSNRVQIDAIVDEAIARVIDNPNKARCLEISYKTESGITKQDIEQRMKDAKEARNCSGDVSSKWEKSY